MQAEKPSHPRDPQKYRYWAALRAQRSGTHAAAAKMFESLCGQNDLTGVLSRFYAADAHLRCGLQALREGCFAEAVEHYRAAMGLNPQNADLASFLWAELGGAAAEPAAADMPEPRRDSPDPRLALALTLWRGGRQLAAIETLRQGLRAEPRRVEWHYHLGVLLGAREAYGEAIAALQRAIDLQPGHPSAHLHLGLCHGAQSAPPEAVEHLQIAQQLQPHDARVGLLLSMAARAAAGEGWSATLAPQLPQDPNRVEVEDLEVLTDLFRREPDVVQAILPPPEPRADSGLFELLACALEGALHSHPQRADLHYHLGRMRARLGDHLGAVTACLKSLEIDPDQAQVLITLAKLCLVNSSPDDAVAHLERVLELGFEYADVYYLLGCLYRDRGDPDRARSSYSRALDINTRYRAAREALEHLAA